MERSYQVTQIIIYRIKMKNLIWKKLAAMVALGVFGIMPLILNAVQVSKEKTESEVYEITPPPKGLKLDSFYKKYVNVNGIHR